MSATRIEPNTRVAVLGAGSEGRTVIAYLERLGCTDVTVCDKSDTLELPGWVSRQLGDGYLRNLDQFEVIFRSPGVPRDLASLVDAEHAGVIVTSATKEFFALCPCAMVGITGSNGKTTTTDLVAAVLRSEYGDNLHVGGNDRGSLLLELERIHRDHVVVLELSSFQLYDLGRSPHVAVVLNVTPNHLDVHPDFEDYRRAKCNILRNQTEGDFSILNWSYERVRDMEELTRGKCLFINRVGDDFGAFEREGRLVVSHEDREEVLLAVSDLPRFLNADSVSVAALVGKLFGIPIEDIRHSVSSFPGVPHRLEFVRELDGVRYYDDSASTTPESAINALRRFPERKVVLIAGGVDKRLTYDSLMKEVVRAGARAVLIGSIRQLLADGITKIGQRLGAAVEVQVADDFPTAIAKARSLARPGDAVVLSPGCASFDMFTNAKERGDVFKELVLGLAQRGYARG